MHTLRMFCFRVAVHLILVIMCSAKLAPTTKINGSYPLEVHRMFRERLLKNNRPKSEGVWSPWSSWTPCSRSCGGGVTRQMRHCIPKPSVWSSSHENQRRQRRKGKLSNHCIGIYKRFHLCNTQKCPGGRDFRREQCAFFNKNPFKGRYYRWEPFLQGGEECALNCRPAGMRFYATLNKTVADGTSCRHPLTTTGKAAPARTLGVCVEGSCKSVATNGVIGSLDDIPEQCAICRKGSCKSISGLYMKPDLPPGYSLITQIPAGACNVFIQQLQLTKNYIALRSSNGSYVLNGEWKFSPSRIFDSAGTRFTYRKQDGRVLETISAPGPLSSPIDILLVYQQPNSGIKYGYALPMEQTPTEQAAPPYIKHQGSAAGLEPRKLDMPTNSITQRDEARSTNNRRRARRRFSWRITGVTPCSKPCGGGLQLTIFSCVREHTQTAAPEKRCSHLDRPLPQQIRCNTHVCTAYWGGAWGPCSGSCGQGVQNFVARCQQESPSGQVIVGDALCSKPKPFTSSRPCRLPPCDNRSENEIQPDSNNMIEIYEWKAGPWSQCSVSCGTGQRTRTVSCPSGRCVQEKRPSHAEYCDSGSCAVQGLVSPWLVSEWSPCSEMCGTGMQTRLVICGISNCDSNTKPETERACSSDRYCVGQWFEGPWGSCSESCGDSSTQKREVLCMVKVRGQTRITTDMTCSVQDKPPTERLCHGSCPARWFVGEWGSCEGICPVSTQRREVRCMEANGVLTSTCNDSERPVIKRPCGCEKPEDQANKPAQDEPLDHSCVDKYSNCHLAVKARLCNYDYYVDHCCVSCRKAPQDTNQ